MTRIGIALATAAMAGLATAPLVAQVRTIDPNQSGPPAAGGGATPSAPVAAPPAEPESASPPGGPPPAPATHDARRDAAAAAAGTADTYQQKDVLSAAENTFGKGAQGLAKLIEDIFRKQGRPTAYIAGREAGGAIAVGVRYGSGTLFHKVEGQRPIFWTGPSVGFDLGANGSKTFVLVYNLYDSQELYKRFPAGEGNLYVVGGFTASYLRWGKVVVIPIRLGVGWRAGVNVGYMRFSEKSRWSPF